MRERREAPYAGWAILGAVLGFMIVGAVVAFLLSRPQPTHDSQRLISAMPREATFELVASNAVARLDDLFPIDFFTDLDDVPAYEAYLSNGVIPAREALALYQPPYRLSEATTELIAALDRYAVTFGAAATCMRDDDPCIPQRHDLRDAAEEVLDSARHLQGELE